jgi:hypothetical protein
MTRGSKYRSENKHFFLSCEKGTFSPLRNTPVPIYTLHVPVLSLFWPPFFALYSSDFSLSFHVLLFFTVRSFSLPFFPVLRSRIRSDPHDFGLLDPHPESAFQMRIPDPDTDPD